MHEPYLDIDYEELESCNLSNTDNYSDNNEFSMLDSRLIDFEEERHVNLSSGLISTSSVVDTKLPGEIYYIKCSQLNKTHNVFC